MEVGDLVRYGRWIKDVTTGPKPIGVVLGFDNSEAQHPRVEIMWPSGNRKMLPTGLFEVVQVSLPNGIM